MSDLSVEEVITIKKKFAEKWQDPVKRAEDIFRVRKADGTLTDLKLPESHKETLRKGILGRGLSVHRRGMVYRRVTNKGRQIGFSILLAIETIMICQEFPNTFQYYIATRGEQAESWLQKVEQLVRDAKHWPEELGGGSILKWSEDGMRNKMTKVINNCTVQGLTANPAGLRGDTAINVILDEFAWMITRKNQQNETYTAIKYFLRQGGQLTAQSTPRVSNDLFWNFFDKANEMGFEAFYFPVIRNWKDLDLNNPLFIDFDNSRRKITGQKQITEEDKRKLKVKYLSRENYVFDEKLNGIRQDPIIIEYPWVKLQELEVDRYQDVEIFKQENLGVPVDERYKLISGDWVYPYAQEYNPDTGEGMDWLDRKDSYNVFAMGIDFAQKRDLTVITIVEKIGNDWYERKIETTQDKYPAQVERIVTLIKLFKPTYVAIDNTGAGIPIGDMLEKRVGAALLRRVNFSNSTKENLATNLKNICHDGRYHVLNHTDLHANMIKHLLKVEKDVTETTIRYTGKNVDQEGRDDGFWSKALAVHEVSPDGKQVIQKMAVGRSRRIKDNKENQRKKTGEQLLNEIRKEQSLQKRIEQEEKINPFFDLEKAKKLKEVLSTGVVICEKHNKPLKPYQCLCADNPKCRYHDMHKRICDSFGLTLKEGEELLKKYEESLKK